MSGSERVGGQVGERVYKKNQKMHAHLPAFSNASGGTIGFNLRID